MDLKKLKFGERIEISNEMSKKDYMYSVSLVSIGKHFLEYFFGSEVYQMSFQEIREKFISSSNNKDVPKDELSFFKFICKRYLDLKDRPSINMLKYYNQASSDLKDINNRIKDYEKDIKELNKINNRKLTNEEGYEKLLLEYYIDLNKKAREEIINFLTHDIRYYALKDSKEVPNYFSTFSCSYDYRFDPFRYKKENITDLHNKFQDLSVPVYKEILKKYEEDKEEFYNLMEEYIWEYKIIDKIYDFIYSHHRLNKREEILKQALIAYEEGQTLLFCNVIPLQIEGVFHDYCIELEIPETDLLASPLHDKLTKISNEDKNFRDYEYFNFKFPIIRNKVAHGNLFKESNKKLSRFLLLDLFSACKLLATSDSLEINKAVSILQEYEKDCSFKNSLKSIIFLQNITIPNFYDLDSIIDEIKSRFIKDDVWNYIEGIIEEDNNLLNRGIRSIAIYLKEQGIKKR
ncbi:hypothetical protein [Halanaerobacter jeridensis]|uniref:Apea-like HEPN domain-containing protein n=1 Tax=Halanaerobacter jeridensis TaxID=706427 RepID=A0A938XVB4_9FIRM|nr:hypothetical protein [Halanaerobacter jeridensis]MBM7558198.1 hypothetical protein [Halanaerobacter jeridensis]